MSTERQKGRRALEARVLQNEDEDPPEDRHPWMTFLCRLQLKNESPFSIAPLFALGSTIMELLFLLKLTGLLNLDMIALSSVCILILLTLVTLLYIRFDKLTLLSFLLLSVSLLCSSTYLVVVISTIESEAAASVTEMTLNESSSVSSTRIPTPRGIILHHGGASASSHLNWIYEIQNENQCCGYLNYTDWLMTMNRSEPENEQELFWVTSCCNKNISKEESECLSKPWTTGNEDLHKLESSLYEEGCGHFLDKKLQEVIEYKFRSSSGLVFWDLVVLVDLVVYTMWKKFHTKTANNDMEFNDDVFT